MIYIGTVVLLIRNRVVKKFMKKIIIGSRGSRLALIQSTQIRDLLGRLHPDHEFEIMVIKTTGDRILDAPLSKIGDKGLFTKELEKELLSGGVDLAVHSMKDMPTDLPKGCVIGAVTARLDPRDVFISRNGKKLADLQDGDVVATGSLRRKAQLLAFASGIDIIDIRGNVQSRLRKMRDDTRIEGTILACAGLERLGMMDVITETVPIDILLPAVGQGSLAVETREGDMRIETLIAPLDDRDARVSVTCERAFLSALGGGCQVPIAGLASLTGNTIHFIGLVGSLDGRVLIKENYSGDINTCSEIGRSVAARILDAGGKNILEDIYGRTL